MLKKIFFAALVVASAMPVAAQETYENAKIIGEDLNGTARYVAMGGAMDALGADLSTMSSNPAGIGLFRRNNISLSFGLVSQSTPAAVSSRSSTSASTTTRAVTSTSYSRQPTRSSTPRRTS